MAKQRKSTVAPIKEQGPPKRTREQKAEKKTTKTVKKSGRRGK